MLTEEECSAVDFGKREDSVDYEKMYLGRYPLLRKAYERSNISQNQDYQSFVEENAWWLADYALFMAVKERFGGIPGLSGRRISACGGIMPWIIIGGNYILI